MNNGEVQDGAQSCSFPSPIAWLNTALASHHAHPHSSLNQRSRQTFDLIGEIGLQLALGRLKHTAQLLADCCTFTGARHTVTWTA